MKIVNKSVAELIPYANNPRDNEAAVDAVASSIENFGFKNPIIIDKNNEIIAGHTRLLAAKKLDMEEVPTIVADDLNEDQIKAFRLADNKVAELANWNSDALEEELEGLQGILDMEQFGFDEMLQDVEAIVEEDDFVEILPEEPESELGDIYQLGEHYLMVGDCTKKEDVLKLMNGHKLDLYITDPPYNVALGMNESVEDAKKRNRRTDGLTVMNDKMEDNEFKSFLTKAFKAANEVMHDGAGFYIWHADSEGYNFRAAVKKTGWQLRQTLIWVKNSIVLGRQDYQWKHEPCLYGWKDGGAHYFTFDRTQATVIEDRPNLNDMKKEELKQYIMDLEETQGATTIIRENKPSSSKEHPTMKPIKLLSRQIANSSKIGQIVGDFFGGSGSTLMACEQLGRQCYTMELDPRYADTIIHRWEDFTGDQAIKIN